MRSLIIEVPGCMPSGWYLTFVMNSLVNAVLMRVAWLLLVSAPYNDLYYFRIYTREKYAGDDNFLSCSDEFLVEFNNLTIAALFAEYDQTYTPACKSGDLLPFQPIERCTFMKTQSGRLYDKWVPLFDWDANLDILNWIRKCPDESKATQDNCNDVLRNMFFYGNVNFNSLRDEILQHQSGYNLVNYYSLEAAYLGYGCLPDPTGVFGFSRNASRNPSRLYESLARALNQPIPTEKADKQSGKQTKMSTTDSITEALEIQRLRLARLELKLHEEQSASKKRSLENEIAQLYFSIDKRKKRMCEMMADCELLERAEKQAGEAHRPDGLTVEQPIAPQSTQKAEVMGDTQGLDDGQQQVTTQQGVNLSEQAETTVIQPVDGNMKIVRNRFNAHLNEPDWDLRKMLSRYNLVGAFQWAIADMPGTELSITGSTDPATDVPTDLLQNDIVSAPFQRFVFWNMDYCDVYFQIIASRYHQGKLGIYYHPSMLKKANITTGSTSFTPRKYSQLQWCKLDPAAGTVVRLRIPFRYNKGWIDLQFGDVLGQIHVKVLNQLAAASGASNSVEVKCFVSFVNSHFRVPRAGGSSFRAQLEKEASNLGFTLVPKERAHKQSGFFESVGSELDNIIEDVLPAAITTAAAAICLDKPAVTEYPTPLTHKDAQYMSATRGAENLERMTHEPSAQYLTDDQFGDTVDECDIAYLVKKPVFYQTVVWNSGNNVGDILFQTPNSPAHLMGDAGVPPDTAFDPTILGFLSMFFTYWRGSIDYIFEFVTSAFHEGRIDACNHPSMLTAPTDYKASVSQYVTSQAIRNSNNTMRVTVPFHSDIPWKRIWTGENLSATESDSAVRATDYITGCFSLRVAAPLKNPNNVANQIDVNIYVCAGDDFEYHMISLWGVPYHMDNAPFSALMKKKQKKRERMAKMLQLEKAVKQAGKTMTSEERSGKIGKRMTDSDLDQDPKTDANFTPLGVGEVRTFDPKVHHFGESYRNLRELAKRYQFLDTTAKISSSNREIPVVQQGYGGDTGGLIGALFRMYRLFRGPMNFKIQLSSEAPQGSNLYDHKVTGFCTTNPQPPLFSGATTSVSFLQCTLGAQHANRIYQSQTPALVRFSTTQVGEFQIPFQSIYHSLLSPNTFDDTPEYFGNQYTHFEIDSVIHNESGIPIEFNITYAWALGDETRFGVFLGCPQLVKQDTVPYPMPGSA